MDTDIQSLTHGKISQLFPHQEELISAITAKLWDGARLIVVNAPPGTGKSVVAIAIAPSGTLISTSTVHLQNQYAGYGLPVLKGRSWYECSLVPNITAEDAPCAYSQMDCLASCAYKRARAAAVSSKVTVINNSLLWVEAAYQTPLIARRSVLIADEAHKLLDDVVKSAGIEIPKRAFSTLVNNYWPPTDSDAIREWARKVMPTVRAATQAVYRKGQLRLAAVGRRLLFTLSSITRYAGWQFIPGDDSVMIIPTDGSALIKEILTRFKIVAMSACITDDFVRTHWGIDNFEYIETRCYYPPQIRPIIFLPATAIDRNATAEDYDRLAEAVCNLIRLNPSKRGVVHTVSAHLTHELAARLGNTDIAGRIVIGIGKERIKAFSRFTAIPDAVLVGPSFSEGVDFAGDLARFQVVAKIPFPDKTDPRIAHYSHGQYMSATISAFIQMYGRGVRSPDDFCVTYVVDSNFRMIRRFLPEWVKEAVVSHQ
ncbi:helicase C-terminal domain-containing protein [Thermogutta sp.]|uniref:helicase C-terminal domain-containing protein n=1 Tax=Thermogutta sp. TaxID=1962930 RepID=UPI0032205A53